jgi:hypothetical protein
MHARTQAAPPTEEAFASPTVSDAGRQSDSAVLQAPPLFPRRRVQTSSPDTDVRPRESSTDTDMRPQDWRLYLRPTKASRHLVHAWTQTAPPTEQVRAAPAAPAARRKSELAGPQASPPALPPSGDESASQGSSFHSKARNFWRLVKERPAYRKTMLAAWAHTAGNGMLNASYMALLANVGGNSPSRSFLAIAIKDLGQSAVFSAVNILGSHRIDSARPINDTEDARRRRGFLSELRSMCAADGAIAAGLIGVGYACMAGTVAPLLLTGALVGLRLCLACKAVYEMSLFPCVRQLLGQQTLGDMITPADRMIPSLEATVSMMTYEAVSCTVQFAIFAQGASVVVPCAIGVAIGGALLSAAPKWLLHAADARGALTPGADATCD